MSQPTFILFCLGFILLIACYSDICRHRIANILTFSSILLGVALNSYLSFGIGFTSALYGLFFGFLCFLPFYIAGGMAAGDVKLMAAVGAFVGIPLIFKVVLMSLICGSFLGLAYLMRYDGITEFFRRYFLVAKYTLSSGSFHYLPPQKGSVALQRFPYAVAIASGTAFTLVFWQ